MPTLSSNDRSVLEKAVLAARKAAETGVRKRFAALDLAGIERPAGLSDDENQLRVALRKRARDLGRGRVDEHLGNIAAIEAGAPFLVEELAYETWHRMLFARFLAENNLLTYPGMGDVTLSVQDVFELAREEGSEPWELAASFAANRLPGLFHMATPLRLAIEDRQELSRILGGLDADLFTASDALGWVYQFWQAERKKQVNASGEKITGNTLPAVTQLFTEDYMVDFLLQNSLGAWYVSRFPDTSLKDEWEYLRYRDDGTPAAGTFESWPDTVAEVTVMDPCCGSGHFLVAALHMLVAMRQEQEGLSAAEAADAVLRDNLFGLELDARCTQIATFAVALEAWKLGGHPEVNLPHIACSGIPVAGQKQEWLKLARGDANMEIALGQLYDVFAQASELGSLIDPRRAVQMSGTARRGQSGFALLHEWDAIERNLKLALMQERHRDEEPRLLFLRDDDLLQTLKAYDLLSDSYSLIATNVPFLGRGKQSLRLREYSEKQNASSAADLATALLWRFLVRQRPSCDSALGGTVATVLPQNWTAGKHYRAFRQELLLTASLRLFAKLGMDSFRSNDAAGADICLLIVEARAPAVENQFPAIDAGSCASPSSKDTFLRRQALTPISQAIQLNNPDGRIVLGHLEDLPSLAEYADCLAGVKTGDSQRFEQLFWEHPPQNTDWVSLQGSTGTSCDYAGFENALLWEEGKGALAQLAHSLRHENHVVQNWRRGQAAWGKLGIGVSAMGRLRTSLYLGGKFNSNLAVIVPKRHEFLLPVWAYCASDSFNEDVRMLDSKLWVTNATLVKVPFDLDRWQKVAEERYPDGLPEPYSSDPTQWLFDGTVPGSDHPLQVAMARLLGYRWPDQADDGLDELADPDGIVCLPSVYREPAAYIRLRGLLERAYGDEWSSELLGRLLAEVEAESLEAWLRDRKGFFAQHVKLFHNRPFLWQVTDGRRDGFSAIVNYHRLTPEVFRKLVYTYLDDWIGRQRHAVDQGEAGAPGRLEAATALREKLLAIYEGEPPFDIYVRWKSLAEQPIGWEPDLNDGVRLNIRPFVEAGVLASKVTVNWKKDRGKDPAARQEPLLAETTDRDLRERIELHASVDRHNDLHFTRAEKERARELAKAAEGQAANAGD